MSSVIIAVISWLVLGGLTAAVACMLIQHKKAGLVQGTDKVTVRGSQVLVTQPQPTHLGPRVSSTGISQALEALSPSLTFTSSKGELEAAEPSQVRAFLKRCCLRAAADVLSPQWRRFEEGEIVCRAGDKASSVLVVASGELKLFVESLEVGTLRAGDSIGQMLIIGTKTRYRTALAGRPATIVALVDEKMLDDAFDASRVLSYCRSELASLLRVAAFALTTWLRDDEDVTATVDDEPFCDPPDHFRRCTFGAGASLFSKADAARSMFVVSHGIVKEGPRTVGPGGIVGGLWFVCDDDMPYDAIAASEKVVAIRLADADFMSASAADGLWLRDVLRRSARFALPLVERWTRWGLSRKFARAGERLEEGVAYLVLAGRVRCSQGGVDVTRGQAVGVAELVRHATNTVTSRTISRYFAARDSELVSLPVLSLLPPSRAAALMRRELERAVPTRASSKATLATIDASVLCVLAASPSSSNVACALGEALVSKSDGLEGASGGDGDVLLVDALNVIDEDVEESEEATRARFAQWLSKQERAYRRVVLVADASATTWARIAVASADAVLIVELASSPAHRSHAEAELLGSHSACGPRQVLVLCRRHGSDAGSVNTSQRLRCRPDLDTPKCVHVRYFDHYRPRLSARDVRRVSRFATGRATGLVLGGGGARGLAHLGALRALNAFGIEIDCLGGCSQGAMIANLAALHDDDELEIERRAARFARTIADPRRIILDYLRGLGSMVSTFSGQGFAHAVASAFEDDAIELEDAWLPAWCVSTDLTDADTRVHRTGSMVFATLASMSVVGYFPPVKDPNDRHLLVDGGYLANLPVAEMRRFVGPNGRVLAVDVEAPRETVDQISRSFPDDWRRGFGGLTALLSGKTRDDVTSHLLYIRNYQQLKLGHSDFDLCIRLDSVQRFGFAQYSALEQIAQAAERETLAVLRRWWATKQPASPPLHAAVRPASSKAVGALVHDFQRHHRDDALSPRAIAQPPYSDALNCSQDDNDIDVSDLASNTRPPSADDGPPVW